MDFPSAVTPERLGFVTNGALRLLKVARPSTPRDKRITKTRRTPMNPTAPVREYCTMATSATRKGALMTRDEMLAAIAQRRADGPPFPERPPGHCTGNGKDGGHEENHLSHGNEQQLNGLRVKARSGVREGRAQKHRHQRNSHR